MSIKIMSAVWERSDLDPYERLVMLSLADHADDDGRCYPSIRRLCDRTGMKERGVQTVLKRLTQRGYLSVSVNAGKRGTNEYQVRVDAPKPPHQVPPASDAPPHPMHPTPASGAGDPPHPMHPNLHLTVNEPSEEPPFVPPRGATKRRNVPLPDGWIPSDRNRTEATDKGFSEQEINHEAECFRDHHLAKGTACKDWDAAWRKWLTNSREFRSRRLAGQANAPRSGNGASLADIAARNRAGFGF